MISKKPCSDHYCQSKHLKGQLGPRVGDVTFFNHGGQLGACVGDVTFFNHVGQLGPHVGDVAQGGIKWGIRGSGILDSEGSHR